MLQSEDGGSLRELGSQTWCFKLPFPSSLFCYYVLSFNILTLIKPYVQNVAEHIEPSKRSCCGPNRQAKTKMTLWHSMAQYYRC